MTVAAGRGAAPETVPAPLTTRMWEGPVPFPMTADGARAFLNEWWDAWRRGLLAAGEDALWAPIGDGEWDIRRCGWAGPPQARDLEPFETGTLEVGNGHILYWEQFGARQGVPVVYLHGGTASS